MPDIPQNGLMDAIENPFSSPDLKDPLNDNWAAKRRLAQATRDMMSALVTCTSDTDALNVAACAVEQQVATLNESPKLYGRSQFEQAQGIGYGKFGSLGYELNPLDGRSNPIASDFPVWIDGDRVRANVTMDWQYEGPPNSVHGGFVAALFDQFLGIGQTLTKQPGFTGTLSVKYLKPTPIATELRLEGWVDRIEGRKGILKAQMWAGDVKTAECEGIFISISKEVIEALKAEKR